MELHELILQFDDVVSQSNAFFLQRFVLFQVLIGQFFLGCRNLIKKMLPLFHPFLGQHKYCVNNLFFKLLLSLYFLYRLKM
jgi:hypothetical protein